MKDPISHIPLTLDSPSLTSKPTLKFYKNIIKISNNLTNISNTDLKTYKPLIWILKNH
jgi:hypothetical protein